MQSVKKIFKIGKGPSSSHTMGPNFASLNFKKQFPNAALYKATLYGSLALTGKGHLTDRAIIDVFGHDSCEIIWKKNETLPYHTNAMMLEAFNNDKLLLGSEIIYSIGGGDIVYHKDLTTKKQNEDLDIYGMTELSELNMWSNLTGKSYWEYFASVEDNDLWDYLNEVWKTMTAAVERGLETEGALPGGLGLQRKACSYYTKGLGYQASLQNRALIFAYALAVSEENAGGGTIVTAPTCGACGVLPAVLYYLKQRQDFSEKRILRSLATAGLIGNIVKFNASISGADCGCQAEIGTACSMASAAACQLFGGSSAQIEYAAEMGMEHHLGMTCDPVAGMVQIPCIERNAFAAARALNCNMYSMLSDGKHLISFDQVVATMKQTGKDLSTIYKETALGGLAVQY